MEWVNCPLCGGHEAATHAGLQRLARCVECGLIYLNPRPEAPRVLEQYSDRYFCCENPVQGGYENYLSDEGPIRRTFARRWKRLEQLFPRLPGTLLDVGCAAGFFLEEARLRGWRGQGLELNGSQVRAARTRGFDVQTSPLEAAVFPEGAFDMVTQWDVIEHFADPLAAAKKVQGWLKQGGLFVLSTPDAGSWMARVFRQNWLGFRSLDEHLTFFTAATLRRLLEAAGFEVAWAGHTGKYLRVGRIITRLRYYTRIGAALLRFSEDSFPRGSFYLNPLDTLYVVARKK